MKTFPRGFFVVKVSRFFLCVGGFLIKFADYELSNFSATRADNSFSGYASIKKRKCKSFDYQCSD